MEYGIHGQPYIETTRRIAKGEQITADYGEWFDYARHIDPIRVGEHQEEDDTLEKDETKKRLSFGEARVNGGLKATPPPLVPPRPTSSTRAACL